MIVKIFQKVMHKFNDVGTERDRKAGSREGALYDVAHGSFQCSWYVWCSIWMRIFATSNTSCSNKGMKKKDESAKRIY